MFRPELSSLRNEQGQAYLRRLFLECSYTLNDKSGIPYTLTDQDHPEGYKSLYRLYQDLEDPTEIKFADTYLTGWKHWEALCECEWFKPYIARWRRELELRLKSKVMDIVKAVATDDGHKNQFEAVKILLNAGWREKGKEKESPRGRPSKVEVNAKLKEQVEEEQRLLEELGRVRNFEN